MHSHPFVTSAWTRRLIGLAFALLGSAALAAQTRMLFPWTSGRSQVTFEIRVPASVRSEKLTGRVYVILTHDGAREPRLQVSRVGAPLFGRDVEQLAPGAPATILVRRSPTWQTCRPAITGCSRS